MPQHFADGAFHPSAEHQDLPGLWVLEGCQVYELLGAGPLGLEGKGVVFEDRELPVPLRHGQAAVWRVHDRPQAGVNPGGGAKVQVAAVRNPDQCQGRHAQGSRLQQSIRGSGRHSGRRAKGSAGGCGRRANQGGGEVRSFGDQERC